jgi:hypothetical protein
MTMTMMIQKCETESLWGINRREEGKKRIMRGKKSSKHTKDIYEDSLKKPSKRCLKK